ncbi:unnamed protein product [Adineta ricciae]|uniref:Peroxisomal membrane protein PEX13 n=1 Tax=Adineta ricciae TaxID=249248 RepID=A0A814U316_ADIRI|nr:unnamed protein product [Adineta ricciae]CAF1169237.1 unnamed protein product [Adineta ricciae]
MSVDNNWEPPAPMISQPFSSSFQASNNAFVPTIESIRAQSIAPPLPPRTLSYPSRSVTSYPSINYPNNSHGQPPIIYNNHYQSSSSLSTSNFTQMAIDESRSAFSSIESVIQTFRSISHVLESTFTNVYTSFRAMIDLFDHFTRLRSELTAFSSLVPFYRFIRSLYHRLLTVLRLRKIDQLDDSWTTVYTNLQQSAESMKVTNGQSSGLLVALFFLVTFGTPILMVKVLNSIIAKRQVTNSRLQRETKSERVLALYDYVARNPDELSFTRGMTIYLAPPAFQSPRSYWLLATIDHVHMGFIPSNYVQPIDISSDINLHPQRLFDVHKETSSPDKDVSQSMTRLGEGSTAVS